MSLVSIAIESFSFVICILLLIFSLLKGEKTKQHKLFIAVCTSNAVALLMDVLSYLPLHTWGCMTVLYALIFLSFLAGYIVNVFFMYYSMSVMSVYCRVNMWLARTSIIFGAIGMFFVTLSFFNGMCFYFNENGEYLQGDYYWLANAQIMLLIIVSILYFLLHRKEVPAIVTRSLLSYPLFPLIAFIPQIMNIGIEFMYSSITLSILVMFISIQVIQNVEHREKEAEISEKKVQLVISQVQPHFIFNSLSAIAYLCKTDPKLAEKTVSVFSTYLRGNLDFSAEQKMVTFSNERSHIEAYLYMEKIRFDDRLNIEYDIQCDSFMLPALSVQPIIENAIKHGICPKIEGGTLKISTYKDNKNVYIVVEDNGVGFDMDKPLDDNRTHFGISNVRKRLELMCKGKLVIESKVGVGTKATMIIPQANCKEAEMPRMLRSVGR